MRIGIDVSQLAFPGSGVARYVSTLLRSLTLLDQKNEKVLFFSSLRRSPPKELSQLPMHFTCKTYPFPPTLLDIIWNNYHIFPIEYFVGDVDIFFTSDWTEPPAAKAVKITTIHDMISYKFPETSHPRIIKTQTKRLRWVKRESRMIFCDSLTTKQDVMTILGVEERRLHVVYPAVQIGHVNESVKREVLKKYLIEKPFILSVGKIEPRKNIRSLIHAFELTGISDTQLLIVGPQGWDKDMSDFQRSEHVRFLGFVPDDELIALYNQALFFIYPSLYEGFGYPVVEAMAAGCPVATSHNSSLQEIAEGYGLLFDPQSIEAITQTIVRLHKDHELRKQLSAQGLQRSKDFSLEKFGNQILEAIQSLHQ